VSASQAGVNFGGTGEKFATGLTGEGRPGRRGDGARSGAKGGV